MIFLMNNKTLAIIIAVLILIGAIIVIAGKLGDKSAQPPNVTSQDATNQGTGGTTPKETIASINLTSPGFSPNTITVKTGTRVIWLNKSGAAATVNSAIHPTHRVYTPLNLGEFPDGSSVQLVFDKPGTYKYHDHLNPSRTGTVVVE